MTVSANHNGAQRRKLIARVKAQGRPCWICKLGIDPHARGETAFNLDELNPRALGGLPLEYANVDATHACCNNWRSTKSVAYVAKVCSVISALGMKYSTPTEFVTLAKQAEAWMRSQHEVEGCNHTCEW